MSDSNSSRRWKFGFTGPRATPYESGVGMSGHGTHYTATNGEHTVDVKKAAFDVGVKRTEHGFNASFSADLLSVGYSNPSGTFKPGWSIGVGGSIGVQDDPVGKRTTFSVFPTRGKTGAEFTVSHDTMERFSKGYKKFGDPNF